ncbi:MAG: hypothetical protein HYY50_01125 [Candidatus Kerfeldbacteria bacterium]|nr:hypothetical protein [Candidatus Kerfeldbacteria bacterium]
MQNLTFDLNEVFHEIINRMQEEGAFEQQAYFDLVEEVLEEKREAGELDDDANIEELEDKLRHRWSEAMALLDTGHDKKILEQE